MRPANETSDLRFFIRRYLRRNRNGDAVILRPYQQAAVDSVLNYWRDGGGNPLVEMATGTGKSVVVASLVRTIAGEFNARVLMLVHVRELVQQNAQALLRAWPAAPLGINSAGLGRRDRFSQVLFASIQSVAKDDAGSIGKFDVIMVDEAHLIPAAGDGQYRTLIDKLREANPDLRIVGFTATPYRLDTGLLYGDGTTFDDVCYSYGIAEGVADGFLSPLSSMAGANEINVSSVAKRGGEFVAGALENAAMASGVVEKSVSDMVNRLENRRAWLAFCSGVDHAEIVASELRARGIDAQCVTGETPKADRDRIIRQFREGRIRCLTNANVLTTGFDAPITDAVVMMRPTLSTGLYVQMLGRGTRLAGGKKNCLVLDYAGNVRRHGPVDAIEVRGRGGKSDGGEKTTVDSVRAKSCPQCEAMAALRTMTCADCGYQWPEPEIKIEEKAANDAPVMTNELVGKWLNVSAAHAYEHNGPSGLSMRVEYNCGLTVYREWVLLDHAGYAGDKAAAWWRAATGKEWGTIPKGARVKTAVREWIMSRSRTIRIQVARDGKYWRVVNRQFERDGKIYEFAEKGGLKIKPIQQQEIAA